MRITESQLRRIIREDMVLDSMLLQEGISDKLGDVIQFLVSGAVEYGIDVPTLGAGAPIGSAAETIIDAAFGAESVASAIQAVEAVKSNIGKFKEIFNSAIRAKGMIKDDLEGFYEEIKNIVKKGLEILGKGAEKLKEMAKELQEIVQKLISKVADAIGDAVKFLIPDAAIGAAAGEAIQSLLETLSKNCFSLIASAIKKAGKYAKFIIDPTVMPEFLEDSIPKVMQFVKDAAQALDDASIWKALLAGGTTGILVKKLGPTGLRKVAEKIDEKKPFVIKLARKITEILIPVTFTLLALAQILYNEEFLQKGDEKKGDEKKGDEKKGDEKKAEKNESYDRMHSRLTKSHIRRVVKQLAHENHEASNHYHPHKLTHASVYNTQHT